MIVWLSVRLEKDCLCWHWLTFWQPERKSSSESSVFGDDVRSGCRNVNQSHHLIMRETLKSYLKKLRQAHLSRKCTSTVDMSVSCELTSSSSSSSSSSTATTTTAFVIITTLLAHVWGKKWQRDYFLKNRGTFLASIWYQLCGYMMNWLL